MTLDDILCEALCLLKEERVQLVHWLVLSLETRAEEKLRPDWLFEVRQRPDELDKGSVQAIHGDEVVRKARALIK